MTVRFPRLLVAAPASGSGKTTVTCALLRALAGHGRRAAAFKCGPDYIDPMFHRESVGAAYSANLDLFLSDGDTARRLLAKGAEHADIALIEGAMGYYDGIAVSSDASAYAVARATGTPVLLVVSCQGMAASVAAQVRGFTGYRPDANIAAVLLNHLSAARYPEVKALVERECGVPVAGYLPPMPGCAFESRHLGLVTAGEAAELGRKLDELAGALERTADLPMLLQIAESAPPLSYEPPCLSRVEGKPRIAVARDAAFCFYYEDTLSLLREMGAELTFFSPLSDATLPEGAGGLLLGGGYPELYAETLSHNGPMRRVVRAAIEGGMPAIAECGGFLYLHRSLEDADGNAHAMAGVIAAEGFRTGRLGRFGYVTLTAREENLLCGAGETLRAHEFHYWDSTGPGAAFAAQKPQSSRGWDCVHAGRTLYAGFPHLYLAGAPKAAERFLRAAADYQRG